MSNTSNQPVGIFDSGVGGLTVANAIRQLLPNEQMIYFGDTAHLPYGDKSKETITYYAEKITEYLLEQQCKVIVIACNTASAIAYENVIKLAGDKAIVLNVIDPVVDYIISQPEIKNIGVIGTKGTINSGTYETKINARRPSLNVNSMPTPLFVPMIEEGFIFDDISNAIIRSYLSKRDLQFVDTLILGCTHYPIIKNQINKFYNFNVDVIDSSKTVAMKLRQILASNNLLNNTEHPEHKFYISDYTDNFRNIARLFFEDEINIEKLNFWN